MIEALSKLRAEYDVLIIELHRTQTPFAVIISHELIGINYAILYQDRYLRCKDLTRWEIRWFNDNNYLFKKKIDEEAGQIWEYQNFKNKMSVAIQHNFMIRNKIIFGHYI